MVEELELELEINPAARRRELQRRARRLTHVLRAEHAESSLTRLLEQQAGRITSDVFLFAGLGAMALSSVLELLDRPRLARFAGLWAPALLTMGVYNKLVKVGGLHAG